MKIQIPWFDLLNTLFAFGMAAAVLWLASRHEFSAESGLLVACLCFLGGAAGAPVRRDDWFGLPPLPPR